LKQFKYPLTGGLYVAGSDLSTYTKLLAAVDGGHAQLVGEHYTDTENGLVKVITVDVRHPYLMRAAANPQITIGREFFVTALKDYDDWPIKWWREAIQNAVDAGADVVHCEGGKLQDGTYFASCADNGRGMAEDVLVNKFLVLGGTSKEGVSTAGGFGKAKELLVLPWLEWEIHTKNLIARGSGIQYEIKPAPMREGTRIWVRMPPDRFTDAHHARSYIKRCFLPEVTFTVNEEVVEADLAPGEMVEEAPGKAAIFFEERKDKSYYLLVRAKGLFMFQTWISEAPGVLIAELLAPSIEMLTANRDGFRDDATRHMIHRLANRIAKDNISALRSKKGMIRKKYVGSGKFAAKHLLAEAMARMPTVVPDGKGRIDKESIWEVVDGVVNKPDPPARPDPGGVQPAEVVNEIKPEARPTHGERPSLVASAETSLAMIDATRFTGPDHVEAAVKQLVWEPDFFLINEIEGWKVPKKFLPETFSPSVNRLAKVWAEVCRFVLIQLGVAKPFGVGFKFSKDTEAAYLIDKDEQGTVEHWLLLNPFKDLSGRKNLYKPTNRQDLKVLYAIAIHEVTHMEDFQYHDESFAAAMTDNVAKCADGFRNISKVVAGVRMKGGIGVELRRKRRPT